jgi:methylglutaconyl-CoA hydratase
MLNRLYTLPKPVIAVVHGAAMGGGLGLVACCDIVLADAHTVFALSEVKLGLIPATIAPYVLRAIGERAFRRYAVTGERFDGRMAKAMGLAHEVAETEEGLQPLLEAMLKQLSANGISAMTESKRLAINLAGRPVDAALMEDTARRIASTRAGAEAKEGLTAFFEKRKPGWVRN